MKYKKIVIFSSVLVLFGLTGCFRSEQECISSKLPENVSESNNEEDFGSGYDNKIILQDGKNVYGLNEQVVVFDPMSESKMSYMVTDAKITNDLSTLDILREDLNINNDYMDYNIIDPWTDRNVGYINESGKIVSSYDEEEYIFLCLYLNIENIDYNYKANGVDHLWIEDLIASEKQIMQADGIGGEHVVYFSEHPPLEEHLGTDYYHYCLEPGEEKKVVIGFILEKKYVEQPLYYVLNFHYQFQEETRFIKIDMVNEVTT